MSKRTSGLVGLVCFAALAGACAAGTGRVGSGGAGGGGSPPTGPSGAGGHGGAGDLGGGFVGSSSSSSSGSSGCDHEPSIDGDGDGWTGAEGDCNDCDPNVNPGAIEVLSVAGEDGGVPIPSDEDCNGHVDDLPPTCDNGLPLADADAMSGARAIELCQVAEESPASKKDRRWGVLDAKYVRANGTPAAPGLQAGLQTTFGANVHPQGGKRLLAISSGRARTENQPDECHDESCNSHAMATPPPGFPQQNPGCEPSSKIADDIGLEVKLRAPTNATGYAFDFRFYSFEFPEWVCNEYNDQFIALVSPPPMGSINGNISFDKNHNAVSVNLAFFDVCDPSDAAKFASNCSGAGCPATPMPYCPSGKADLEGTGFGFWQDAGATSWLTSQAPVTGGSDVTIRFAIWDTGDDNLDSTALVDNFRWIATGGNVVVSTDPVNTPK